MTKTIHCVEDEVLRAVLLLVLFEVHAKFQVHVKFASMCLFVDNLSGEEGEEKKPNNN